MILMLTETYHTMCTVQLVHEVPICILGFFKTMKGPTVKPEGHCDGDRLGKIERQQAV